MTQYLVVSSDGQMTGQEMLKELQEHRICPAMTYQVEGQTIVPLFTSVEIAQRFGKRNTHRDYVIGTMAVNASDLKLIEEKGWKTEVLTFPNKRQIIVEVIELTREVETHNKGFRSSIK